MDRVELVFKHADLDCVIVALDLGHRCGYVRVPEDHPWCGIKYMDVPSQASERLDSLVDVHGGLTFSDATDFGGAAHPGWWIGFDCAHFCDGRDPALMRDTSVTYQGFWAGESGHVWNTDDVKRECEKLAEQVLAASAGRLAKD